MSVVIPSKHSYLSDLVSTEAQYLLSMNRFEEKGAIISPGLSKGIFVPHRMFSCCTLEDVELGRLKEEFLTERHVFSRGEISELFHVLELLMPWRAPSLYLAKMVGFSEHNFFYVMHLRTCMEIDISWSEDQKRWVVDWGSIIDHESAGVCPEGSRIFCSDRVSLMK